MYWVFRVHQIEVPNWNCILYFLPHWQKTEYYNGLQSVTEDCSVDLSYEQVCHMTYLSIVIGWLTQRFARHEDGQVNIQAKYSKYSRQNGSL